MKNKIFLLILIIIYNIGFIKNSDFRIQPESSGQHLSGLHKLESESSGLQPKIQQRKVYTLDKRNDQPHNKSFFKLIEAYNCGLNYVDQKGIKKAPKLRIVGGQQAEQLEFPWIVSLQVYQRKKLEHQCGGAIINEWLIITAAHCLDK